MKESTRVKIEEKMQDVRNITEEVCDIIDKEQYEDFKVRMIEEYQARTGKELMINSVVKNNGVLDGFVMKLESSGVTPNVYAAPLYQLFKAEGFEATYMKLTELMESSQANTPDLDLEFKTENLILQIIGSENNSAIKEESPYKTIEGTDLIAIYKWLVCEDKRGICSTRIKSEDMARYGLDRFSEEELYNLALENTKRLFPGCIRNIMGILAESGCPVPDIEDIPAEERLYVITNTKGISGATSILYNGILKEMADAIGGDFYIIPSSIHEVLCISSNGKDAESLKCLVGEVNNDIVDNQDRLSYSVYLYEVESGSIKVAA